MMSFSKPIARIYVSELRRSLDPEIVPIFTPDTAIEVGDFGSFKDGRFVRRGNVADRGVCPDIKQQRTNPFTFASVGKISIGPSAQLDGPAGAGMLKADVRFTGAPAVIAAFAAGVEYSVRNYQGFSDQVVELWRNGELPTGHGVVWSVRRAEHGTILISGKAGSQVQVLADTNLCGPAGISLSNLAVGVTFGAERKAIWKMSEGSAPLTVWTRIFALSHDQARILDAFGYQPSGRLAVPSIKPTAFTADDLLKWLQ